MIIEATPAEAAQAFKAPLPPRSRHRPVTTPAEPVIRSTPFLHGEEQRLGVSVLFGGKAFLGSVALVGESLNAGAVADLLEEMAGMLRSAA